MKNKELLAAANKKAKLINTEKKSFGDKLTLALLWCVVAFSVFMFWKHKAGF